MDSIVIVIVPIFIGIVAFAILLQILRGLAGWMHNNSLPRLDVPARVIAKREEVRSLGPHSHHHVRTRYHATFELDDGRRFEFPMDGREYGVLMQGDEGTLSYQGTRYHGFQR
ncbi:DUF2500 domain-containing protein [Tundrisphaera sp. TA3]|uniref:DUF2500 domain-containing protein n=1 Tax=Tundrisphaera sp. TA3 TaxID=3435775 RepID=UPI003EBF80FA